MRWIQGRISEEEDGDVLAADIVIRGRARRNGQELYVAIEVSCASRRTTLNDSRRAAVLGKLGRPAVGAVAGQLITADAADPARQQGGWLVTHSRGLLEMKSKLRPCRSASASHGFEGDCGRLCRRGL